jgi:hypothetical protein
MKTFFRSAIIASIICATTVAESSAQIFPRPYQGFQELYADAIGTTVKPGFGGVVVPIRDEPILPTPASRDLERIVGYHVYRRAVVQNAEKPAWQRINDELIAMKTPEAFEKVIGTDGITQGFSMARRQKVKVGEQVMTMNFSSQKQASRLALASKNATEFITRVRSEGTLQDVIPFMLNPRSLELFGMVYVDRTADFSIAPLGYEYAIAPITFSGNEGEKEMRGAYSKRILQGVATMSPITNVSAKVLIGSTREKRSIMRTQLVWTFLPKDIMYTFAVYRSVNGTAFEQIDTFLAQNDSTVVGDGVQKTLFSMKWSDSQKFEEFDKVEYKIAPLNYLENEYPAMQSQPVYVFDRATIPVLTAPEGSANNDGITIQATELPAKKYIKEYRLLRAERPDAEFQIVKTLPVGTMSMTTANKETNVYNPQTKKYTQVMMPQDVYSVPMTFNDPDGIPNTMYYYKVQAVLADGSVSTPSPYTQVWREYTVAPSKLTAQTMVAMPLDEAYRAVRKGQSAKGISGLLSQRKGVSRALASIVERDAEKKCGVYMAWDIPESGKYKPRAYYVQRSDNGGQTWQQVGARLTKENTDLDMPEYIDTTRGLHQYRKVLYRVIAENISGYESEPSEPMETYPSYNEPIQAPGANLTAERIGSGEVAVRFHDYRQYGHVDGFAFYRRTITDTNQRSAWRSITPVTTQNGQFIDATVHPDSAYQYAYSLHDIRGVESPQGVANDVPEMPRDLLKAVQISPRNLRIIYDEQGITLVWDPVENVNLKGYSVLRAGRDRVFSEVGSLGRAGIVFKDTIEKRTVYYYKVIPIFQDKPGIPSEELPAVRY